MCRFIFNSFSQEFLSPGRDERGMFSFIQLLPPKKREQFNWLINQEFGGTILEDGSLAF
jgi:hypothetical protein